MKLKAGKLIISLTIIALAFAMQSCKNEERPVETSVVCGGVSNFKCPNDFFCKLEDDCGGIDLHGTCSPRPRNCNIDENFICGCDKKTYKNECIANINGISVKHNGKCEEENLNIEKINILEDRVICGGINNYKCGETQFCNLGKECGGPTEEGFCDERPVSCLNQLEQKVCGCDEKIYKNQCEANITGITVRNLGSCPLELR